MKLKALSLADLEQVRLWRNEQVEMLRTPFLLTKDQQEEFYRDVVCNRQANARYWGIWWDCGDLQPDDCLHLFGMGGIENIQWENRLGEISLLLNPAKMDHWENALTMILRVAFMALNLKNVYTEVYLCSPLLHRWSKVAKDMNCITTNLPQRKYCNGGYHGSMYINFNRAEVTALC